jgi:hypothetical protein
MAKNDVTGAMVLQLHSNVMDGLLTNVEEGLPGEYRKVLINVGPQFADVPPLVKTWFQI